MRNTPAKKQKKAPEQCAGCESATVTLEYVVHRMNTTKFALRPVAMVCSKCGGRTELSSAPGITVGIKNGETEQKAD